MKQIFADALAGMSGKEITETFLVSAGQKRESKTGKTFLALTLVDRTGTVGAKFWDYEEELVPTAGQFVKVKARVEMYQDKPQLVLTRIRIAADEEVSVDDYLPASKRDRDQMITEIRWWVDKIQDQDVKYTVSEIIHDVGDLLRDAPAAKGMHQAYLGGLSEHILQLCSLGSNILTSYPGLNLDLLIAAAIIHDIGKVFELSFDRHIANTRRGHLVGHIVMGLQLFQEHRHKEESAVLDHLEHIIASHHGKLEWGSPVVPMTREAIVFHLMDMIDSRMAGLDNAEADPARDDDGFVKARTFDGGWAWFQPQETK